MDLSNVAGCSSDLYLRDISPEVRAMEDNLGLKPEEGILVTINFANEGDRVEYGATTSKHETQVFPDRVVESYSDNSREQAEMRAYLTLNYVRCLDRDGKPIFPGTPVKSMGKTLFREAWRSLPPAIADAINTAILIYNPEGVWEG